jgi:aspartyl-tRNA(Asn)/glutamyl-tRNA(Gln) amidotransferase subunit C
MVSIIVDKELIKRVAKNARLSLSEEELEKFVPQIKEVIVDSFNLLDEIDAKEEPSFQPVKVKNRFRKDRVKEGLDIESAFKNVSPKLKEGNYFKGPKVL